MTVYNMFISYGISYVVAEIYNVDNLRGSVYEYYETSYRIYHDMLCMVAGVLLV